MSAHIVGLADMPHAVAKISPVIWFRGVQYIPCLWSIIREYAARHEIKIQPLSLTDIPFEMVEAQCAMSFLGMSQRYWIGDCTDLPKKKQEQWRVYITRYDGPHVLMFYAHAGLISPIPSSWIVIDIPEYLTGQQIELISDSWYAQAEARTMKSLLASLCKQQSTQILTDNFLNIHMYVRVVGKSVDEFASAYGPHILTYQPSLFGLSQCFFEGNAMLFYAEWARVKLLYQVTFWITFWSEQLWRAHAFIDYMHSGDRTGAYEISKNRLPYAFTKDSWRRINVEHLRTLHDQLYTLDVMTKNSGDPEWIELMFARWFSVNKK